LDTTAGRIPCNAEHCEHSSCAAIKNNYDVSTSTFKAPPPIRRSDGTNALRKHEPRVYTAPFQIPWQDQEKFRQGISQQPTEDEQDPYQPNQSSNLPDKSSMRINIFRSCRNQRWNRYRLPAGPVRSGTVLDCRPVVTGGPAGRPVSCRSTGRTGRPAGPVRSDRLKPVPVPVVKNPDRFHLW